MMQKTMKTTLRRTNALGIALVLGLSAVALAPAASAGGDCNFTNYGVYTHVGDYNCESNDTYSTTVCQQGAGAGAGSGGAGAPSAAAGASTNCDGGHSGSYFDRATGDDFVDYGYASGFFL